MSLKATRTILSLTTHLLGPKGRLPLPIQQMAHPPLLPPARLLDSIEDIAFRWRGNTLRKVVLL